MNDQDTSRWRARIIGEMGLGPLWRLRGTISGRQEPDAAEPPVVESEMAAVTRESGGMMPVEQAVEAVEVAGSAHDLSQEAVIARDPVASTGLSDTRGAMDWQQLQDAVASCSRCGLCASRHRTVFGVGDVQADWLFIGEGPGRNEDMQGEPFVGPAGKLLNNMLAAMGVQRGRNAFIANIVKCRPADDTGRDRPPAPEEVAACLPFLERQIALIKPRVLVALGKTAAVSLLGLDPETSLSSLRGRLHRYQGLPLVITYHPAYLLRAPEDKAKSWRDLCMALEAHSAADDEEDAAAASDHG